MFQNRSLGREESLLRHGPTTTANLVDHPGEWYEIGPAFPDEHWKVATLNLTLAGDGLLQNLRGFGGAGGVLEIGLFLSDGLGGVGDLAPLVFHGITSAKEWEAGSHAGTLVDLKAGNYHDGRPRAGLRGDLRQAASGTGQWTSAPQALRYGRQIDAVSWEADLIRDDRGQPLDSARLILQTGVFGPGGMITWSDHPVAATGAQLAAGRFDFSPTLTTSLLRWRLELDFLPVGQAAYAEEAVLRTSTFFLLGTWIHLASPWWTITSLADLIHRGEADRELRPAGWDGTLDACLIRLPLGMELAGRLKEKIQARLRGAGAGLQIMEIQAVTDVWYEEQG
jgi:hypothetical protein